MAVRVKEHGRIEGVYWVRTELGEMHLATRNMVRGVSVYGERLVDHRGVEYRLWDPHRSKLAAYILKGADSIPLKEGGRILYLGAGSGTTASHVSDIVGSDGQIFCVEFAQHALRKLVDGLCRDRGNLYPVLADARFPDRYPSFVTKVETIYCDVAQPDQARIVGDNARLYLEDGGWALIAFKARSVDVTLDPVKIFRREIRILEDHGFSVQDFRRLEPFQTDHAMVLANR
ncbi:MAG: fibrillarin-like rRNA/tRNA 2'-O-methyltransferase [Candidatus Bathyarchaeia archaeon]